MKMRLVNIRPVNVRSGHGSHRYRLERGQRQQKRLVERVHQLGHQAEIFDETGGEHLRRPTLSLQFFQNCLDGRCLVLLRCSGIRKTAASRRAIHLLDLFSMA